MKNTILAVSGSHLLVDSREKSLEFRPDKTNYKLDFLFRNVSDKPIRLIGSHSSCRCTVAKSIPTVVEPLSTKSVEVWVSSIAKPGPLDETVRVYTDDDRDSVISLRVQGHSARPTSPAR